MPKSDKNNLQPRAELQLVAADDASGLVGMLTGGDKFVLRGGYARTHDYAFLNIALNIVSSFPYVAAINRSNLADAFNVLQSTPAGVPAGTDPNQLTRTVVHGGFPLADGGPVQRRAPAAAGATSRCGSATSARSARICSRRWTATPSAVLRNPSRPARAWIRRAASSALRANTAESWYHSLQTGLEKRLSGGLSAGLHYTWSHYLDTASEIFNPSSGEVAVSQDSFDIGGGQGPLVVRPAASADRQFRLGTADHAQPAGCARQDCRRLAVRLVLHAAERRAVHAAERLDPTGALAGIDGLVATPSGRC